MATAARKGPIPRRVARLEGQVGELEVRVDTLEDVTSLGASVPSEPETTDELPRCPGCNLAVESPRGKQCVWCGFVFAAARPRRRK